jgi:hypothetical protein
MVRGKVLMHRDVAETSDSNLHALCQHHHLKGSPWVQSGQLAHISEKSRIDSYRKQPQAR